MRRLLIAVASLVVGAQALGVWASVVAARRLSNCGSQTVEHRLSSCGARAYLLRGMWDLLGPGLEPTSPALAGGFLTTAPPGKPQQLFIIICLYVSYIFLIYVSSRFVLFIEIIPECRQVPVTL